MAEEKGFDNVEHGYPATAPPVSSHPAENPEGATGGKIRIEVVLGIAFRALQVVFSLISFSVMSSMKSCDTNLLDIDAFAYLVAAMVIQFVWSLCMLIVEVLDALSRLSIAKDKRFLLIRFCGEFIVSFMSMSGASAAAGVTTTFNSLSEGAICSACSKFCSYSRSSTAFAFFAWITEVPSFIRSCFVFFQTV